MKKTVNIRWLSVIIIRSLRPIAVENSYSLISRDLVQVMALTAITSVSEVVGKIQGIQLVRKNCSG